MSAAFMPIEGEAGAVRARFHRLANARENPAHLAEAREWLLFELDRATAETAPPALNQEGQASTEPRLLAYHAPLALLEGAWLQDLAQPANHEQPAVAELFAAHLALLGADEAASPACAYRGRLQSAGLALAGADAWRFAQDPRIGEPALRLAGLQLALGLHAAEFFPEALGFTLAYLASASPWRLPALPPPRRGEVLAATARHAESALQAFTAEHGDAARLRRGQALHQAAEAEYLAELARFAANPPSLAEQVGELLGRKRRFARGYHGGVKLGGRGLEDWFAETPFDAPGFLAALAGSPYVRGEAGRRPFDRLTGFGGPMFGVFDRRELALIDAWLSQVESGSCAAPAPPRTADTPQQERETPARPTGRLDRRGLFHRLINQDPSPQTRAAARLAVENTLARARRAVRRNGPPRKQFFDYTPDAFAGRIAQIHDAETAKHRPFQPPPRLRREEYVWAIRQFAPAVLVDGCWLRHQGGAARQDSRLHRLLQRIYAEELGEGRPDWNHPKIYRDLLGGLGVELPGLETEAFARHPGFLDAAFDLPNHLLAISLFPQTYLPEILGLNLAIELSGLGAGYMRLAEELRHWGIDPLIVKLHLSIDNLAGGHAAMACEAVQLYLDEIRSLGGEAAVQAGWRRIWSGYLSLDCSARRFKWALAFGFCREFLPARVAGWLLPGGGLRGPG